MSRLSIDLTPEQHQQIKALAALQGKSMKDFILGKLFSSKKENAMDDVPTKAQLLAELKQAFQELKAVEEGKSISRPLSSLLDEL